MESPTPILLAGPTASGKSALALRLAAHFDGAIINADALQVYDTWRILTARPTADDLAKTPHRLYGHVPLATPDYSVGRWLREVGEILPILRAEGRRPIVVGGTGLYFRALTEGLADVPPVPAEIHARVAAEVAARGVAWAAARLIETDPATAQRLDLDNPRRVARALEVLEATGRGLSAWTAEPSGAPLLPLAGVVALRLAPDRAWIRARITTRFQTMVATGALDEAAAALALNPPADAPGLKALGAAELMAHLRGEHSLEDAIAAAVLASHRYAKRQDTWGRNQMAAWRILEINADVDADTLMAEALRLVDATA